MSTWIELFRSLGRSLVDVYRAELAALGKDLASSGKQAAIALVLFGGAAAVGFWAVGVLVYTLIQLLTLVLRPWAAAAVVALALVLVVAGLAFAGMRRLRRAENPVATVERRLEDHLDWWQNRFLPEEKTVSRPEEAEGTDEPPEGESP